VSALPKLLPERAPAVGEMVHVRSRRWLVELVQADGDASLVRLACAEDDAQGEELEVVWELELDRAIIQAESWGDLGRRGFDDPRHFAAFLNTLRWNAVTATDARLFQAPFRAGIKIDAYQMEPLRKALQLPRVNLFIADDTGLGKTIEAGLIATELLLRKKARTIVVAAPPSVLEQWKGEFDERFGLRFEVLDRQYVASVRRDRGFGVNPWRTHSRFLVSHHLLVDPAYAEPLREWLGDLLPGSLLILDEAHHAAPASGRRYGIETKFTRAIRDLAPRFEHRLFLSATPHNGHSNSFSTLLELLDPYRFTSGVKVRGRAALAPVMVRRLKEDIRAIQDGFPQREIVAHVLGDLPDDAPELELSRLLDEYRTAREQRLRDATSRTQAMASLLVVGLQQRLLSSIEAFALSLAVHRRTISRQAAGESRSLAAQATLSPPPDADDDRASLAPEEMQADDDAGVAALSVAGVSTSGLSLREDQLLNRMTEVAQAARHQPDAKVRELLDWIREHLCPDLPPYGAASRTGAAVWLPRRVLIFTENREGTKRYLQTILEQAITCTDQADDRIAAITGLVSGPRRQEIQRRFNTHPDDDPLRILIATDAAREGLNFQAHCADLFHFDLPWNPGRIEQRNGRIDRKLQPADEVRCHHFVLPQRVEDRVLEVLVRKTATIREELGSLSRVLDHDVEQQLAGGIRHRDADKLRLSIEGADLDEDLKSTVAEELDAARDRQEELAVQIETCRRVLDRSRAWVGFDAEPFRDALSCSLELAGAQPLVETHDPDGTARWRLPAVGRLGGENWAATLDSLRAPRRTGQHLAEWRAEAPIRPVVFEDAGIVTDATVHLHLEQRVAHRLLSRFRSQGFLHDDLSRACLAQVQDSIPRVVLLGRLALYGRSAERLHEVIVRVAARWIEPGQRNGPLTAYAREAEVRTGQLLDEALRGTPRQPSARIAERLLQTASLDIADLLPQLDARATEMARVAEDELRARGAREAEELERILTQQRSRVANELERFDREGDQLQLIHDDERRQRLADVANWRRRLAQFERELETEPSRIAERYVVKATRVEPVGVVYLWPDTN